MRERNTDASSIESDSYFESLSTAVIRTMYKPRSPEYDPNEDNPNEDDTTTKKDRKRKQSDNPRPTTRSTRIEAGKEKEKEKEGAREGVGEGGEERDDGTQTDPTRAIQTEPGPSRTPLPPSIRGKRARMETEKIESKMLRDIVHLTTTCNKILDVVTSITDLMQDHGSRIGVLETRLKTLQETRRDTAVQALETKEPKPHGTTPHVPRREEDNNYPNSNIYGVASTSRGHNLMVSNFESEQSQKIWKKNQEL